MLLGVALLLTRVPLLGNGYGSDDDAWRNIVAALHMRAAGHYIPSRVPGFPVFEALLVLLSPWGWVATNAAAILAGAAAVWRFWCLLRRLEVRTPLLPALGFAFGAPMWVRVSQTMDYAFGLAFFIAAYEAALRRRHVWAGVLLALATGCRPSYALIVLAMGAFLVARRARGSDAARFGLGYALTAAGLFVPLFASPEGRGLHEHLLRHAAHAHVTIHTAIPVARGAVVYLLGKLGALAAAFGLIAAGLRAAGRDRAPRVPAGAGSGDAEPRAAWVFELTSALLLAGFFLLIPYEDAYLLPLLPLALIGLGRALPRAWLALAMFAMASEPLVSVQFASHRLKPGALFQEIAARRADLADSHALLASHPATPTLILVPRPRVHRLLALDPGLEPTEAGWAPFHAPGVALWSRDHRLAFAEALEPGDRARLEAEGWVTRDAGADRH